MNKTLISVFILASGALSASAEEIDSLRVEQLNEVVVSAVRAQKDAPFAKSNISAKALSDFSKTGRELPFLFAQTPGVLAWSENGLGTGTTYMRIRGAADSRINVTLDGVALNSPEDQCVFWANMNSYGSLLGSAQIQRGVGTSTNGDGAFGGTVSLTSKAPSLSPYLDLSASYGSYNTSNLGGNFSTGLLCNHWVLDGAYHETNTDGYIHGTNGRSGSYYGGLSFLGNDFIIRYRNIGNFEKTGQAWNGIDTGDLLDGNYGVSTGINSYEDMYKAGLGKYNTLYEYMNDGSDPAAGTSRYQMNDGSFWPRTTDNFWQNHNLLTAAVDFDKYWSATATLHYTHGYGYYTEFRSNNKLSKFGLANMTLADNSTLKKTDFVRKKGLTQDAYGMTWNVNYKDQDKEFVGGMSLQQFSGNHYGYLTYVANDELAAKLLANGNYQYYDSDASKGDMSAFIKGTVHINDMLDVFADMQYRWVQYYTGGYNDKFYANADGTYSNQMLHINKEYNLFNPKAGVSFHKNGHSAFASVAVANREPERNNFTDNGSYAAPEAEQLIDWEAGYNYTGERFRFGIGLYYMDYVNQFVQTGEVSDIGEALTTNIKDSYRMGAEITAGLDLTSWLTIEGNAALSQNKIKDFDEVVEDWDNGSQTIHYDNSTLAFSPSLIANGFINLHWRGLQAVWHTGYVSRQYLDNSECEQRSLPAYCVSNANISYAIPMAKRFCGVKGVTVGLNLNNIFDKHYAASGWVYSAIYASGGHTNDNRYREIGYIPMAGFNAMGTVTVRF